MDKGLEGTVDQVLAEFPDKEIYFKEYDWNAQADDFSQEYAISIRDQILADFAYGLKHARTLLWDKETDIREVFQYAEFGSPTAGNVKDYGKLNQRYFNLINSAKSVPHVNFGLIQSMKDEWIVNETGEINPNTGKKKSSFKKSGRRIKAGFDRLDELVMTELHFRRERGQNGGPAEFYIDVGKCRQNTALQDQTFPGMAFQEFGTLLVPGTTVESWE
jgi:hypothetical protein